MANSKKFSVDNLAFVIPAALIFDILALFAPLSIAIPILGIPLFLMILLINIASVLGLSVWFALKWRSIMKEDGFEFNLLLGGVLVWAFWIIGMIGGLLLPTRIGTVILCAFLTNHYKAAGTLVDWGINIATLGSGMLVKAGVKTAVKQGVKVAAKQTAKKTVAKEGAELAIKRQGGAAAARLGTSAERAALRRGEAAALEEEAAVGAERKAAEKGTGLVSDETLGEPRTVFERMQEYFEEMPQPRKRDEEEEPEDEGPIILEDDENKVDLRER